MVITTTYCPICNEVSHNQSDSTGYLYCVKYFNVLISLKLHILK